MKFIGDQKQNTRLSHVLCTYVCSFMLFLLLRVKLFSHIVIVCVVFLTLVSCFNNIRILGAAVRLRNVILRVIQTSHPSVSMHAEEFFSTALEESSAALVHHKVILAPKLFGGGGGSGLRCGAHANILQGRSAATPQLPPNVCCTNTNQHIQGGTQSASHLASTLIAPKPLRGQRHRACSCIVRTQPRA